MATLDFTITYDDEKQGDLLLALRDRYGQKTDPDTGELSDYTPLELKAMLQSKFVGELRSIYLRWKKKQTDQDDLGAA